MTSLLTKVKNLPNKPGIYLMKDKNETVLYVGKAKDLCKRVTSYFIKNQKDLKTQKLVKNIQDIEIIIVSSEEEALLLERSAIKKHKPRFNILLRDDKDYPYLEIDSHTKWPRLRKVRRKKDKKNLYFGPFTNTSYLRSIVHNIYEVFPLIRCTPYEFGKRKKPCHYYHMKKCLGPCTLPVKSKDYKNIINDVVLVLKGKDKNLEKSLVTKMKQASQEENYELATSYRDQINAFKSLKTKQSMVKSKDENLDIINFALKDNLLVVNILLIRKSYLDEQRYFIIENNILNHKDTLRSFILEYYETNEFPKKSFIPFELEDTKDLCHFLKQKNNFFSVPEKGENKKLMALSQENAFYHLEEHINKKNLNTKDLKELQKTLKLKNLPRAIECLDISNIQETATVASLVCFKNLKASKKDYKLYNIKQKKEKPDDYESIREIMKRRLERGKKNQDLPDLFVIDGGKGQLSAAYEICKEYKLACDLISLAKNRTKTKENKRTSTQERVFFVGQKTPLALSKYSLTFRILTQIRDEAHRFAITHHRKKRDTLATHSSLLDIKGLGPSTHKLLLEKFKGLDKLKQATLEDLTSLPRISKKIAQEILKKLK